MNEITTALTPEEVLLEFEQLSTRILELGEASGTPVVIGYAPLVSEDEDTCIRQNIICGYFDRHKGIWTPQIATGSVVMRIENIPETIVRTVMHEFKKQKAENITTH